MIIVRISLTKQIKTECLRSFFNKVNQHCISINNCSEDLSLQSSHYNIVGHTEGNNIYSVLWITNFIPKGRDRH